MNQYRCETCKNRKGVYDIPFCDCWDKKIPITKYGMDLISHIGCSSHSDFQSERDKVLDILDEWLNSDDHLSLYKWEVREKIRELRQAGEP
jgi:hypothetical protein